MGEAFDVYLELIEGKRLRMPNGFWNPPEGHTRLIEIIRKICQQNGIHPSELKRTQINEWKLQSALISLHNGSTPRLARLASEGIPFPERIILKNEIQRRRKSLTNAVMQEVWIRDGGKCIECGSMDDIEFDHMIPFSKGGSCTPDNLRILCRKCNRSRGNRI